MKVLLSCTGPLTVLGVTVLGYGIATASPLLLIQGFYLTYIGIHMTWALVETIAQEDAASE